MTIEERVQFLMQSTESHDRQLGELTDKMAVLTAKFDALGGMMAQLLGAMKTLVDTVTDHERRITGLEGQA
jgi:ABC-type transporter Mla subunit MlaD